MRSHKRAKAHRRRDDQKRRQITRPPLWKMSTREPYLPTVDSRPLGLGHARIVIRDGLGRYVDL